MLAPCRIVLILQVILAFSIDASNQNCLDSRVSLYTFNNAGRELKVRSDAIAAKIPCERCIYLRGGGATFEDADAVVPAVNDYAGEDNEAIIEEHRNDLIDVIPEANPSDKKQNAAQAEKLKEQFRQEEAMRQNILSRVLTKEARSRLGIIAAVKPDRARRIEDNFINQARCGMILQQVGEEELIKAADEMTKKLDKRQEIRFARRRSLLDSLGLDPELAARLGVKTDGWRAEDLEEAGDSERSEEWGDELAPVGQADADDAAAQDAPDADAAD